MSEAIRFRCPPWHIGTLPTGPGRAMLPP
jgi:hypothetical protein